MYSYAGTSSSYFSHPLYALGQLYILILILRAVFTWFPVRPGTVMAKVQRVLWMLTEPVLAPVRRVVPPLGMFDMSYLLVLVVVYILTDLVFIRVVI